VINDSRRRTDYLLSVTSPLPIAPPSPALSSLSVDPTTVTGGENATGRVWLTMEAPAGGEEVQLLSSDPDVATVPPSVTVQQGSTTATFPVTTNAVDANQSVTIGAIHNQETREVTLNVNAEGGPIIAQVTLSPTVVQGGESAIGTAMLSGPAPPGGALVTLGSSNTDVATVPENVTVAEGEISATFTINTLPQQFNQSSSISARHGGELAWAILSVTAGPAPELDSLTLDPDSVTGGESATGTVTLTEPAPLSGLVVELTSSNSSVANVPESVTIGGGSTSATFTVSTSEVGSSSEVEISGLLNGITRMAILSVNDGSTPPALSSLSLSPTTVTGGESATGMVTLTAAAPPGGMTVTLLSSNTAVATVPASVTVPDGATSATFTVSTSSVSNDTSVTISASHDGVTRSALLSVTAPAGSDTVTIERARYHAGDQELEVRAESSNSSATLSVYVTATGEFIGTLDSNGRGEFDWPANPENITVQSSLGGSATANVELR
jgi:trimeric autotransporter adhesin